MMHSKTKSALINLSFPSDLIDKIEKNKDTLGSLKECSTDNLLQRYTENELNVIAVKIKRAPIPSDISDALLEKAKGACSCCASGDSSLPFQIHHIEEYSRTQDNSEGNLIVVCPTCHASIHKNKMPYDEQKSIKRAWESIVSLANEYELKGLQFPYGSFEAVDYSSSIDISQLFEFKKISPSTCGALFPDHQLIDAKRKLDENHYLTISGASGSGKSTYAFALGFSFSQNNRQIYRYLQPADLTNRISLKEIAKFAAIAIKNCVLIIDDANQLFTTADLREISSFSNERVKIIICQTSEKGEKLSIREISDKSLFFLSWDRIKDGVSKVLIDNEDLLIRILRDQRKDDKNSSIGYGPFGMTTEHLINRYMDESETVWQFMFLLSAGWIRVDQSLQQLIYNDRSDLYVFEIAIKQIADFEAPSTVNDISGHLETTLGIKDDDELIRSQIESFLGDLIIKSKGRYKTIHRDWALAYISASVNSKAVRPQAEKIIHDYLSIRPQNIRRINILWSWFKYDDVLGETLRAWYSSLNEDDWKKLFRYSCESSLSDAASLAYNMHLLFPHQNWTDKCARIFSSSESILISKIKEASEDDITSIRHLFMAINHASKDLATRITAAWNTECALQIFESAIPRHIESISWLLSGIKEHSQEWISEISKKTNWISILDRCENDIGGNIDKVGTLIGVGRILNIPLMRSLVSRYVDVICKILTSTELEDLRIHIIQLKFIEVTAFRSELQKINDSIRFEAYGAAYSTAKPEHWGKMLSIFSLLTDLPGFTADRFFDNIDFDALLLNIQRWHKLQLHEFRLLIYTLAYADNSKKEQYAEAIFPYACHCLKTCEHERNDIAKAYYKLSPDWCEKSCKALEIESPEVKNHNNSSITLLQEEIIAKDAEGQDYDIYGED